jgi:tRNA dimethylallyltransferase
LHSILRRVDAAAATRINKNDVPKIIRAIEVCFSAKQPMSEQWKAGRDALVGFTIFRIGIDPDRAKLYQRINQRVLRMFDSGLVDETEQILKKYGEGPPPLASLGYKQAVQLLRGELDREAAIHAVQQAHRNYAKRQMTWFRREPQVTWIHGFGDDAEVITQAVAVIRNNLQPTP